jgi:hypothetical protein
MLVLRCLPNDHVIELACRSAVDPSLLALHHHVVSVLPFCRVSEDGHGEVVGRVVGRKPDGRPHADLGQTIGRSGTVTYEKVASPTDGYPARIVDPECLVRP